MAVRYVEKKDLSYQEINDMMNQLNDAINNISIDNPKGFKLLAKKLKGLNKSLSKKMAAESLEIFEAYSDASEISPEKLIELYNDGYFELLPKYEDAAMPWDANLDYDSSTGELIFDGGFLPSGVGYAQARIPFKDIWKYFEKG